MLSVVIDINAETSSVNVLLVVNPPDSALSVKMYVPEVVGVPESVPLLNVKPSGIVPSVNDHKTE